MPKPRRLPPQLFNLGPIVLPWTTQLFLKGGLKPAELFTLLYVRYSGKTLGKNKSSRSVVLRSDLGQFLKAVTPHKPSGIANFIDRLCNRKLLSKIVLTPEEKKELYNTRKGRRAVIVLTRAGVAKICAFKAAANDRFPALLGALPPELVAPILAALGAFAKAYKEN